MTSVPWNVGCVIDVTVCAVLSGVDAATGGRSLAWCCGGVFGGAGGVNGSWFADLEVELKVEVASGML